MTLSNLNLPVSGDDVIDGIIESPEPAAFVTALLDRVDEHGMDNYGFAHDVAGRVIGWLFRRAESRGELDLTMNILRVELEQEYKGRMTALPELPYDSDGADAPDWSKF